MIFFSGVPPNNFYNFLQFFNSAKAISPYVWSCSLLSVVSHGGGYTPHINREV